MKNDKSKLLRKQLNLLKNLGIPALRDKFLELYGFECNGSTSRHLRRRIAWRLQEIYLGGLKAQDEALLEELADRDPLANLERLPVRRLSKFPGVRYSRVWRGTLYEVVSVGDGTFEYAGGIYRSLSAVAAQITGTHWNGKLFFGVK